MLLKDKLKGRKLILASRSARRRQLLADAGLAFTLAGDYVCEEIYPPDLAAEAVPEYLANLKSEKYPWPLAMDEILVTADTGVIVGNCVLGKPADRDDAVRMLKTLSGREHRVVSGVTIRDMQRKVSFSSFTVVSFREMTGEEIGYYVDTYQPYDKAGAYGIQEWIGYVAIRRIEGSYFNVVGLPVQQLYVELDRFLDIK